MFQISTLCWLIRTNAMKKVDATVVSVMMPFSSIITTIVSIIMGKDTLSFNLIIGITLLFNKQPFIAINLGHINYIKKHLH